RPARDRAAARLGTSPRGLGGDDPLPRVRARDRVVERRLTQARERAGELPGALGTAPGAGILVALGDPGIARPAQRLIGGGVLDGEEPIERLVENRVFPLVARSRHVPVASCGARPSPALHISLETFRGGDFFKQNPDIAQSSSPSRRAQWASASR